MTKKETVNEKHHLLLVIVPSSLSKDRLIGRVPSLLPPLGHHTDSDLLERFFDRVSLDCRNIFYSIALRIGSSREVHDASPEAPT
jgi:hypothetical protein